MRPAEGALISHRIVEVPRPSGEPGEAMRASHLRMLPPTAVAHTVGSTVVCCWIRARPHGRATVLVGGHQNRSAGTAPGRPDTPATAPAPSDADAPAASPAAELLGFPAGARAVPLHPEQVERSLSLLPHWRETEVALDAREGAPQDPGPDLEDLFTLMPDRPMAFLVVAEPVTRDAVTARLEYLSDNVDRLEGRRSGRGSERVRLARTEAELTYLERWYAQGLWRLRLWTAARSAAEAHSVAGLLSGGADLAAVPLRVRPRGADARGRDIKGRGTGDEGSRRARAPVDHARDGNRLDGSGLADTRLDGTGLDWAAHTFAGADAVVALARPPHRELPGVRVVDTPAFDLTPESGAAVRLGSVLDATRTPCVPFGLSLASLNRHVFVTGATGGGKSQTVRALLEELTRHGIPWLVVEPAKAEYRAMAARLAAIPGAAGVTVVRPGEVDGVPAGMNPLEPAVSPDGTRFPLQTHLDLVRALFVASFQAEEPFPQVLSRALTRCYEDLGWDLVLGEPSTPGLEPRYPTLEDLERSAERVVAEVGYGQEVNDNVRGFVRVRLGALRLGATGRFFQGGHPVDFEDLLGRNVVLEIEDVGDDQDKAFLMGTVLLRLTEHLRLTRRDASELRHVTVVEEAHRLLRHRAEGGGAAQHAVEMFASLLAEVRAYGEGLVISDQVPVKLVPDVVKNTSVKIVHRLPALDDREVVGATMNLVPAQSAHLVALPPGQAAVFADGMDHALLVALPDGTDRERGRAPIEVPGSLVRSRSAACPAACAGDPCSLRRIRAGQRMPETVPWLTLWAELTVLGHLTGWPPPVPGPGMFAALREWDERTLHCAVGQAVDTAVAARSAAFSREIGPSALAGHVAWALRSMVAGTWPCPEEEPRWRVAKETRTRAGRDLLLGSGRPSALEDAVGRPAESDGWEAAMTEAVGVFPKCRWPVAVLRKERHGR